MGQPTTTDAIVSPVSSTLMESNASSVEVSAPRYGLSFTYPASDNFYVEDNGEAGGVSAANFVTASGTIMLSEIGIASYLYPNSNFAGGRFSVFVNPTVSNASSCAQYGSLDRTVQHPSILAQSINGITYSETTLREDSMTVAANLYEFHTLQNDMCYEFDLEIDQAQPIYGAPSVYIPTNQLEVSIFDIFMGSVEFSTPQ
jgi:hypothetical protein